MTKFYLLLFLCFAQTAFALETTKHWVAPKETLMTISHTYYGTHQCWKLIVDENKLSTINNLEVGDQLYIPTFENCKHPRAQRPGSKSKEVAKKIDDLPVVSQLHQKVTNSGPTATAAAPTTAVALAPANPQAPPKIEESRVDEVEKDYQELLEKHKLMLVWEGQTYRIELNSPKSAP